MSNRGHRGSIGAGGRGKPRHMKGVGPGYELVPADGVKEGWIEAEQHTCQRIIDWLRSSPRPPAHVAFTEGPLRDVAYAVEMEMAKERTPPSYAGPYLRMGGNSEGI